MYALSVSNVKTLEASRYISCLSPKVIFASYRKKEITTVQILYINKIFVIKMLSHIEYMYRLPLDRILCH